jgi:outer membrane protein TolC
MLSVERPIRVWGKRGLDTNLAEQTQAFADIEYSDALHEGSRELLKLWFVYLRALVDQKNAATTYELASKVQRLTQSQLKQGEVSRLNAELASAEFESSAATRSVAEAQLASAASALARRYPALPLPTLWNITLKDLAPKAELNDSMLNMRQLFLEKNHELNMLRIDAQRLLLAADRVSRDRMPDPTLGVFAARDRGGAEQVVGVMFSMPWPGDARTHHASAAFADAQAASDRVILAEQQLGAMFESMWSQYAYKRLAAESLQSAALRQAMAAEKSVKAFTLGEGNLSDALLIARLAANNLNAAERMQLEVIELLALIRLDLHQIWDFDE